MKKKFFFRGKKYEAKMHLQNGKVAIKLISGRRRISISTIPDFPLPSDVAVITCPEFTDSLISCGIVSRYITRETEPAEYDVVQINEKLLGKLYRGCGVRNPAAAS